MHEQEDLNPLGGEENVSFSLCSRIQSAANSRAFREFCSVTLGFSLCQLDILRCASVCSPIFTFGLVRLQEEDQVG